MGTCCIVVTEVSPLVDETPGIATTVDEPTVALGLLDVVTLLSVVICCVVTIAAFSLADETTVGAVTDSIVGEFMVAFKLLNAVV